LRTLSSGNPARSFHGDEEHGDVAGARLGRASSSTRSDERQQSWARIGLGRKALAPFRRQASARSFSLEMMITGMWRRTE